MSPLLISICVFWCVAINHFILKYLCVMCIVVFVIFFPCCNKIPDRKEEGLFWLTFLESTVHGSKYVNVR